MTDDRVRKMNDIFYQIPYRQAPYFKHHVECADGFTVSIQASEFHYSSIVEDTLDWLTFELGYPSDIEPLIIPYVEDEADPTETVYAHVPAEVVYDVIQKHGGVKQ